ncbi:MAG: BolA family protein [Planctomycetota bacterium]
MIRPEDIVTKVQAGIPDAKVEAFDTAGDAAHWRILVVSTRFEGMGRLDRHRLVMAQLEDAIGDGRPIHAVEIRPMTPAEAGA